MTKFCPECGSKLPDDALFCDECGTKMPDMDSTKSVGTFTKFTKMKEAAEEAIRRNSKQYWSYWDSPKSFYTDTKKLLKFCEKEDKRLSDEDRPVYVVSKNGAVGQIFIDEVQGKVLEWGFYTEEDTPDVLPSDPDEL